MLNFKQENSIQVDEILIFDEFFVINMIEYLLGFCLIKKIQRTYLEKN